MTTTVPTSSAAFPPVDRPARTAAMVSAEADPQVPPIVPPCPSRRLSMTSANPLCCSSVSARRASRPSCSDLRFAKRSQYREAGVTPNSVPLQQSGKARDGPLPLAFQPSLGERLSRGHASPRTPRRPVPDYGFLQSSSISQVGKSPGPEFEGSPLIVLESVSYFPLPLEGWVCHVPRRRMVRWFVDCFGHGLLADSWAASASRRTDAS